VEHCGIDLHGKSSEVAVVNEAGELVETARIPTTEAGLRRWFGGRAGMRICLEAGGMSAWAERILVGLGHEVVVCNPARVRLIAESTLKNDRVDAETPWVPCITISPSLIDAGPPYCSCILALRSQPHGSRRKLRERNHGCLH
jgi:hypothetical protein